MSYDLFKPLELAPRDPILGLTEAFSADQRTTKVNLGVGVYYDDAGKIPLLRAVQQAEQQHLAQSPARGYLPIEGIARYNQAVQNLLFGVESPLLAQAQVVTVQSIGGTGALKIGADFLKRINPAAQVWISDPSWENHRALFEAAGFSVNQYPYYDEQTHGVDFAAMCATLNTLPPHAIVVFHACCHNPTGADLNEAQWQEIVEIAKQRHLIPFLDLAYQGFSDGIEPDAIAVALFARANINCLIASSFSKSFSLYGERIGALSIVTANRDESARVLSQVKRVIRTNYSNPPTHGASMVAAVLNTPTLRALWEEELSGMRDRIRTMRLALVNGLIERGVKRDFSFVLQQRGMFSYSGLTAAQVERLKNEFGIYAVSTGRICIAALNTRNINAVIDAIAAVL